MKRILPASLCLLMLGMQPAIAQSPAPSCEMQANAQLNLQVSGSSDTVKSAHADIEAALAKVQKIGAEAKLDVFELVSESYNINTQSARHMGMQSNKTMFSYNANVQYRVEPAEKAKDVLASLVENDMQGNISVRKNRAPNCRR